MSGGQQTIYIFQCSKNRKRYGATAAQTGINLPAQDCLEGPGNSSAKLRSVPLLD